MGKNKGRLLETRIEQAIEKLYEVKRGERWTPTEIYCLLRSGPAALAALREESVIQGFDHFKGSFEDLYAIIVQALFLRERLAVALAPTTKKRRQRKPSPPVEDRTIPSRLRRRKAHR
jgi:hypothetical protein